MQDAPFTCLQKLHCQNVTNMVSLATTADTMQPKWNGICF